MKNKEIGQLAEPDRFAQNSQLTESAQLADNWKVWLRIEPAMRRHVGRRWYEPAAAEDVLGAGMERFVKKYKGNYPEPQQIRFAQLCCRHAARGLGYWRRGEPKPKKEGEMQGVKQKIERVFVGLDSIKELEGPSENIEKEDLLHRLGLVERVLARGCCPQIRDAVALILAGQNQLKAAQAVGWSPVQLSRALAEVGQAILGHRPAKYKSRAAQESGQLALWGANNG